MGDFTIRTAEIADLETVRTLLDTAERELRARGLGQWPLPMPDSRIKPSIRARETFLVNDGNADIATITLNVNGEPFWPRTCTDALFPHRMVVIPRGTGLGTSLLDWAGAQAEMAGRSWLRIDVWKANRVLQRRYQQLGFEPAGTVDVPGSGSGALFARPARWRAGWGPEIATCEPRLLARTGR